MSESVELVEDCEIWGILFIAEIAAAPMEAEEHPAPRIPTMGWYCGSEVWFRSLIMAVFLLQSVSIKPPSWDVTRMRV